MVTPQVICTARQGPGSDQLSPLGWWPCVTDPVTLVGMNPKKPRREKPPIPLRIRAEREARGWSLEDLAGRLGVARQTVGRWETSGRDVGIANLFAIAAVMEIPVRQLLPGDDGLTRDKRSLLEAYRAAPSHERRAMLGMAVSLHEGRQAGVVARSRE